MGAGSAAAAAGPERKPAGHPPVTTQLDQLDYRIVEVLAAHEGASGAWPGVRRIAARVQRSDRTVQRRLAKLVAAGLVERVAVFERLDDPEWQRRRAAGVTGSQPRGQTTNTYRVTPPGDTSYPQRPAHPPVTRLRRVTPERVREAGEVGTGDRDSGEAALIPPGPVEIAVEPPAELQLGRDPGLGELLATLDGAFGHVQVLEGASRPATYRTARGRLVDLVAASAEDLHRVVDQLDRHTCNGARCQPDQPCRRHARRRRT
jgi:hypothetical protein